MGIVYVAVAILAVAGLLFVFHRLSRPPDMPGRRTDEGIGPAPAAESVADEAERWLRSQS